MIIKHYKKTELMENPWNLNVIKFHDSPHGDVLHLTLAPGEQMLPHISPVTLLFYILEGNATVRSDEEYQTADAGSFIECPNGVVTCVYNKSEKPLRLLIVKIPKTDQPPVFVDE